MQRLLIDKYIPSGDPRSPTVRSSAGQLAGAAGILLNALLFGGKLAVGLASGSVSILSDAFNNLSDMGSSAISIISARLSTRRPDREHPFGHGRAEYVSSLIIAFIIMVVGFELLTSSVEKLVTPGEIEINFIMLGVMFAGSLVKLWMYFFNRRIGRLIESGVQLATARDSLNDFITTLSVALASFLAYKTGVSRIDGAAGAVISLLVMKSGYDIARETIDLLLGGKPDPELARQLREEVLKTKMVVGAHDLIIHDYGPGRVMASVHAEVPDNANIVLAHEAIDEAEQRIDHDLGIPIVIHLDPISVGCARTDEIHKALSEAVREVNPEFSTHDFRMTDGENRINLIFDLVVPAGYKRESLDRDLRRIEELMLARDARYRVVAHIDENIW